MRREALTLSGNWIEKNREETKWPEEKTSTLQEEEENSGGASGWPQVWITWKWVICFSVKEVVFLLLSHFTILVPPQAETTIGFENILRASFSQVPTNTQHHTPASVLPPHSWDLRQVWEWFCLQGLAWHLRSSRENYNPFCLYLSNKSLPFG